MRKFGYFVLFSFIVISRFFYSTSVFAFDIWRFKITPLVQYKMYSELESDKALSVVVLLKEQADLTPAQYLTSKEAKGEFVYKALVAVAQRTQGDIVNWLTNHNVEFQRFYIANMIVLFNVDKEIIEEVAMRDDVQKIMLNPTFRSFTITNYKRKSMNDGEEEPHGIEPNIIHVRANEVWEKFNFKGEGIVIGGQDTGVQWDHPAIKNQYRGYNQSIVEHDYNWHDAIKKPLQNNDDNSKANSCGYNLKEPCDDHAHGTHTIGTIVGDDGNGNQIGLAPNAKWIACRNMDSGLGALSTYIECFEWFLAPYPYDKDPMTDGDPTKAPHVINNSWGCPPEEGCYDTEILPVLYALKAAGIMVVASAGNEGPSCETITFPPAMHSGEVLSVGAYNHRNNIIASFSSRGPSKFDGEIGPDVTAPGVSIRSSIPKNSYASTFWSGTSMAAPHVVGQVALMWSANKSLIGDIDLTTDIIKSTAIPTQSSQSCGGVSGDMVPNNVYGWGRIDVFESVNKALQVN